MGPIARVGLGAIALPKIQPYAPTLRPNPSGKKAQKHPTMLQPATYPAMTT